MAIALAFQAVAQPEEFSAKADTNKILIGERVILSLTGKVKEGADFEWPVLPDTLNGLELVKAGKVDTATENGLWTIRQRLELTSFDSGYAAIPPLSMRQGRDSLRSQAIAVSVALPQLKEGDEIYDIKAPMEAPFNWWLVAAIAAGAVLVAALVWAVIYWIKKRKKEAALTPEQKLSPYEYARLQLKEIEKEQLWQKDRVKEYYSRLTDVMRLYMERQLGLTAMESTADEVTAMVYKLSINKSLKEEVAELMELSALVKFAKEKPGPAQHQSAFQTVDKFIESTKPREQGED